MKPPKQKQEAKVKEIEQTLIYLHRNLKNHEKTNNLITIITECKNH